MRIETGQSIGAILGIFTWILIPGLAIWILIRVNFITMIVFIIIQFIASKIWELLCGLLLTSLGMGAALIQKRQREELDYDSMPDGIPAGLAFFQILLGLGVLAVPVLIALVIINNLG